MSLEELVGRLDVKLDALKDTFDAATNRIVEAIDHLKDSAPDVDFAPLVSEIHAARQEICEKLDAFEDDEPKPAPAPLPDPEPEPMLPLPDPLPDPVPEPEPPKPAEKVKKNFLESLDGFLGWE